MPTGHTLPYGRSVLRILQVVLRIAENGRRYIGLVEEQRASRGHPAGEGEGEGEYTDGSVHAATTTAVFFGHSITILLFRGPP